MSTNNQKQRRENRDRLKLINNGTYAINEIKQHEKELLNIADGSSVLIEPPFNFDYGTNIHFSGKFYANMNCLFLDTGDIFFGTNVKLGPGVQIYTVNHPVDPIERNEKDYWRTASVSVGDNVWIGGGAILNPGVSIGNNSVIGSGSVVTKSIPANVLAAGVPAKIIKELN